MAIPKFQDVMLPLLEHLGDGSALRQADIVERLAVHFSLNDRLQRYEKSQDLVFSNIVSFTKTHLKHALLVEYPERGTTQITERGRGLLAEKPHTVTMKMLLRYPEYGEFRKREKSIAPSGDSEAEPEAVRPPEQLLSDGYRLVNAQLSYDLLEQIKQCSPTFFERLVLDVLIAMGYGGSREDAAAVVGKSGDGGIDGIIKEDRLGLDAIYVQAKRWQSNVGREIVQSFVGALHGNQAQKGVFITTSEFTLSAQDYVRKIAQKVVLIDGQQLAQLMIEYGVGVTPVQTYVVKKIDGDYFEGS